MARRILVVANETIGSKALTERVNELAQEEGTAFVLVVPQNRPKHGDVIYLEAVRDAAEVRVSLARQFMAQRGIEIQGEVGDSDPFLATMDAIDDFDPDELIVSTKPATVSGWLRKDLVERIREASGLPVEHIVSDIEKEGPIIDVTLVVANQTVGEERLLRRLKEKAAEGDRIFIVVVPQDHGLGHAADEARARLSGTLARLHQGGLLAAGMIGAPDPYTATMNALQSFHITDIVISTFPETKSGWLRADLIERVRSDTGKPVEHVVAEREPAEAAG